MMEKGLQLLPLEPFQHVSEEDLSVIYSQPQDLDAITKVLSALQGVEDYTCDARGAILMDYCRGIIKFALELGLLKEQASFLYSMAMEVLHIVRGGGRFQEAEALFKDRMLSLTLPKSGSPPTFTLADLRQITDHFTRGFFQHYSLYRYVFLMEQDHLALTEMLHVETAIAPPLSEALTYDQLLEQQAANAAAQAAAEAEERARVERQAEEEAQARAEAQALAEEEEKKRRPQSLEEAVDFAVRDRVREERKVIDEDYVKREQELIEKIQKLEAQLKS